ncbi:MAG: 50S ribosomal protein L24 [Proteobacteria bacterium]|jgi:large subunit ribosomal protein L24|nr:50S ribosomal protein L24 [Pseudomonadota bacterium]
MNRIRKGDEVRVMVGRDKGERGKVLLVDRKTQRIKVEKANMIKKHVRPSQKNPQGGIVEREGFMDISNVQLWDSREQRACRVTVKRVADGGEGGLKKVRVSKLSGETI